MIVTARFGTRDIARAKNFYDALAEILEVSRVMERDDLAGYGGPSGGMLIIGEPLAGEASVGNGSQITLQAPSRAAVDAAHAKALELGGSCEGAPGLRGTEPQQFYGAYFRDIDGNKLMVVHRS